MPPPERVADEPIADRAAQESPKRTDAALYCSIIASVVLHIGLLLLFGYFSANSPGLSDAVKQPIFELFVIETAEMESVEIEPIEPPEPETIPSEPENAEIPISETPNEPVPVIAEAINPEELDEEVDDNRDEQTSVADAINHISPERIRAQLRQQLDAAITLPDQSEPASGLLSSEPVVVPGMPTAAGWLNNYVGTVEASLERWGTPGGALNARMVLPSGHVICIQGAAPAHGEIFHIGWPPIAMSSICGRERPTTVDPTRLDTPPMIRPVHIRD